MKNIFRLLIAFAFVLFTAYTADAQQINLVRFNNTANYTSGSGVSVIINPTGVFKLDNHFILELSDKDGNWGAPTKLNDLTEFYVPVINGTLPSALTTGTNYKLRVRSTNPVMTIETGSFQVNTFSGSIGIPTTKSALGNNSTFFNCEDLVLNQVVFGTLTQSSGALVSGSIGSQTDRKLTIQGYDSSFEYKIKLTSKIDVPSSVISTIDISHTNGVFYIPTNLEIGTYIFEIEKVKGTISSVTSILFLFHGNATSLGNSSTANVCVGNEVKFTVKKDIEGIGRNYFGSKYEIDFGDGVKIVLTHAELLAISPLGHTYNKVSCGQGNGKFIVKETLFNKGVKKSCNDFIDNGEPIITNVNTSLPPVADFSLIDKQCENKDIVAVNSTVLGQYGASGGNCEDEATFTWYYKKPSETDFTEVNSLWIDNINPKLPSLKIPTSFITEVGCWQIKLESKNNDLCQTVSEKIKTIKIEAQPTSSFTYTPNANICPNTQISFTNTSNVLSLACQEPSYLWEVIPVVGSGATSSGFVASGTNPYSQRDLTVTFNQPGSYDVKLTVTNTCGPVSSTQRVDVFGGPTVSIAPTYEICDEAPAGADLDFSTGTIKPIYSPAPYTPSGFNWTISGSGVTAADYEFIASTSNTSQYPKIRFKSYKTYNINVAVNGTCGNSNQTCVFTLKQTPVITNNNASQSICAGTATAAFTMTSDMVNTTYSWTAVASSNLSGYIASGSTDTIGSATINNNSSASGSVVYTITPTNNGCVGNTATYTINVVSKPKVTDQTAVVCSGTAFTVAPTDGGSNIIPTGIKYSWSAPTVTGGITGGAAGTDQANISGTLVNPTNTVQTATYTVTPTAGTCTGTAFKVTVTVNPKPAIANINSTTICSGASFSVTPTNGGGTGSNDIVPSGTTYTWSAPTVTGGITGGTARIDQSAISGTLTNTSNALQTATYTVTPKSGNCPGTPFTVVVTVNPSVKMTLPVNQTICNNGATTAVTFGTANTSGTTTYAWTNNTTSIGLGASGNTNITSFTAVNSGTAPVTATITVTPTLTNDVTCQGIPQSFTITVNPTAVVNDVTDLVVCNSQSTTVNFGTTNTGGTVSYGWTNDNASISLGTSGIGNISFIAANTTTAPVTANITVTPTFDNAGKSCAGTPKTFKITVNPSAKVNSVSDLVLCDGDDTGDINFSTTNTTGTTTYSWSNSNAGIGLAASGNGDISSFKAVNTTNAPVEATITVTPKYFNEGVDCSGTPITFKIKVNPKAQVNSVANQMVCAGASASINFSTLNTLGTTTYSWVNDTPGIGLAASGTGNISAFTATNAGTAPVTANITVTPSFTYNGKTCSGQPMTFTLTVNPKGQVNAVSNQTVCNGTSTTAIAFNSNNTGGTTNYSWTNNTTSIGLASSGSGNITAFNAVNNGITPVTATVVVTPIFVNGISSCAGNTQQFTITVNPSPTVTFSAAAQTICSGLPTTAVNLSSSTSGAVLTWTAVQPSGITGVTTSGTNSIPVQTLVNTTNAPITVTYTATAKTNDVSACVGVPTNYSITVNPKPAVTATPTSQTICSGTATNIALTGSVAATTFSWTVSSNANVTGASVGSGSSIAQTLTNNSTAVQTITYTITPSFNNNSVACPGDPITVVITVNPKPVITSNVSNQTICSGSNSSAVSLASATSGVSLAWTATQPSGITGVATSGTDTIPLQTLANSTNAPITINYDAIATTGGSVACAGPKFTHTITVNPKPVVTASQPNQTICSGTSSTAVSFTSTTSGVTFAWTCTPPAGISGASTSGTNTLAPQTLVNSTTEPIVVNYTVVATTSGSALCPGAPFIYSITVNPKPVVTASIANQTICSGNASAPVALTSTTTDAVIAWTCTPPAGITGAATSGTNSINTQTLINSTTAPITVNYIITVTTAGTPACQGSPLVYSITVNPAPAVQFSAVPQTICSQGSSTAVTLTSTTPGVTFAWTATQPAGITGVTTTGTNTIPVQTLVNSTDAPIIVTYNAMATTSGGSACPGSSYPYSITVNPKPAITESFASTICSGNSFSIAPAKSAQNLIPAGTTYSWSAPVVTGGITGGVSGSNQTSILGSLTNPTNVVQRATYMVTPSANGCLGASFTVTVTVNPTPSIKPQSQTICSEESFSVIPVDGNGNIIPANTTYKWTVSSNANVSGQSDSFTNGVNEISQTLTNLSNVVQTLTYTVTPTSGAAGNCTGPNFTITIKIDPKPSIENQVPVAICSGTSFTVAPKDKNDNQGSGSDPVSPPIPLGSNNIVPSGTTYTWTVAPNLNVTGWSDSLMVNADSISQILINSTNVVQEVVYTVTPKSANCIGGVFTIKVTVNPKPVMNAILPQTICGGQLFATPLFNSNVSGTTFDWKLTNSNVPSTINGYPQLNGSGNINGVTVNNTGTTAYKLVYEITPSANDCKGTPVNFELTVNPAPAVKFSESDQTICTESASKSVKISSDTPNVKFSWNIPAIPAGLQGVTPISGQNDTIPSFTLKNDTSSTIVLKIEAFAATDDTAGCQGQKSVYTITINPKPVIKDVEASTCGSSAFSVTPPDLTPNILPAGTAYSWGIPSVTGGITGGTTGSGETSILGTLINPTNISQMAIYTVTPSVNGCPGDVFAVKVTVNPTPSVKPQSQMICSEESFSVTPVDGNGNVIPANTTYRWTVSANSNITGQSNSSASGISTIGQNLVNTTNIDQTVIYTVTPVSGDVGSCVGADFTITVIVNPKPSITDQTTVVCSGLPFTVMPTNVGNNIVPSGTVYSWATPVSNPVGAVTGGAAQGIGQHNISQTLSNNTDNPATLTYTVTPKSGDCEGNPFTLTVTVNPKPKQLNLTDQVYCNGVTTNPVIFSNSVTGTTYSWTNSNTAIGLGSSGNGDVPAFTATNSSTNPLSGVISVTATANGCSSPSETFTITVNPSPDVKFSPSAQTICSGGNTIVVTLSSSSPNTTFAWTAVQPADITGVALSGTDTIPVQTLVNSTNAPITVQYVATASANGGATCPGAEYKYDIVVNPMPNITDQSTTICSKDTFAVVPVNGVPDATALVPLNTKYIWTVVPNQGLTGWSDQNVPTSTISQTLTNATNNVQILEYNVTPFYQNCIGKPFKVFVTVNPTPLVFFSGTDQTICNNTASAEIKLSTNAVGNVSYSWICKNPPAGVSGFVASGTDIIPSQTLVNSNATPITLTYEAVAQIDNAGLICKGVVSNYTITVNPTIQTSSIVSNYKGYNVSVWDGSDGFIDITVTGGSGKYTYNWNGPNGFVSTAEDVMALKAGNYNVAIYDGYCEPVILTFVLTQPPELKVQEDLAVHVNNYCFGESKGTFGIVITQGSVPPYTFELIDGTGNVLQLITESVLLNQKFEGLKFGKYSVKITDANGGSKTVSNIIITQPDDIVITATTTPITCYGGSDGTITLNVTGGTAPFTAEWDDLATGLYQNNLKSGTYNILVTDANNCTKPISVVLPDPPVFKIDPVVSNISCFGEKDGSIALNLVGGIKPVSLKWADGSTAGLTRNGLPAGTYSFEITDSKPCKIKGTYVIVEPQLLVLSANVTNALDCDNANSGAVNLMVAGGTPPFNYAWSNGVQTEDLVSVSSGNFAVTVTDSRGCGKVGQYNVTRPAPITVEVKRKVQADCETKIVQEQFVAKPDGGVGPYTFDWSSGNVNGANNEMMTTGQNGMVLLNITDDLGCKHESSFIVDLKEVGKGGISTNSYGYLNYGIYSIKDPVQFTATIDGDIESIMWDFGDGTFSTELNPKHIYNTHNDYVVTQTVTYPYGCVYTEKISLMVAQGYVLVVPTAFTPNDDSLNDTFRPVTRGLKNVGLDVFDTWGSLVYSETGDSLKGWDGKIKGKDAENGNYNCKVSAETFYGTMVQEEKTFVLIK